MILHSEVDDGELDSTTSLDLDLVDAVQVVAVVLGVVRCSHGAPASSKAATAGTDEFGDGRHGGGGGRGGGIADDVGSLEAATDDAVVGVEDDHHLVASRPLDGRQGGTTEPLAGNTGVGVAYLNVIVGAVLVILNVHIVEGQRDYFAGRSLRRIK